MHLVDSATRSIGTWLRDHPQPPPIQKLLGNVQLEAADAVLSSHRARVDELSTPLKAGDENARIELAELAETALYEMRDRVRNKARHAGIVRRWVSDFDAWWRATKVPEYLDDPDLDRGVRVRVLANLDSLNDVLGSYQQFFDELRPLLSDERRTRVLDLAAGHGGFALEAARIAKSEGLALDVVASDIKREYLDLGEPVAERENLPVRFVVQDALDLGNVAPGEFAVITCTQSLHHFGAGLCAVMLSEALRVASRGVLFVDGCRSALYGAAVGSLCLLRYGDRAFAHDAWISFRRFFSPEELGLLVRLTPFASGAEARFLPPGHCLLRVRKS